MQETRVWSLCQEDPLEKEMAAHSSILAWEIPRTEELGGLQRVRHNWVNEHTSPALCDPMDYSPPGFSVHGISQGRILEWVAISFSKGSSQPSDRNCVSSIDKQILYHWATWEAPSLLIPFSLYLWDRGDWVTTQRDQCHWKKNLCLTFPETRGHAMPVGPEGKHEPVLMRSRNRSEGRARPELLLGFLFFFLLKYSCFTMLC